jgi:DNA polymerase I-like protein with 3'-5' exonuclease and polymerase domains
MKTLPELPLDIESYYPWPGEGDYPQPLKLTLKQLEKRRLEHKAHPYAKDSRRCALRFITVWWEGAIYVHDYRTDPVLPDWLLQALAARTIIGHNLDFDITVLRRYGIPLSGRFIDTMIAARLLGLGKERGAQDAIEEELDAYDEAGINSNQPLVEEPDFLAPDDPTDNSYGAVVTRYTGVKLAKEWGNWDWAREISSEQRHYIEEDVVHLLPTWKALEAQLHEDKLFGCFEERMEFLRNLNIIKMTGCPIQLPGIEEECREVIATAEEITTELKGVFADFQAEVPKSRRRKLRGLRAIGGDNTLHAVVDVEHIPMEGFRPTIRGHVIGALALHGIVVPDAKKKTLAKIDSPETRLLVRYSETRSRIALIQGIARNTFADQADGWRVRAGGWNQLAARTGRIHSTEPNLQNIPRKWRHRFCAPAGYLWLASDLEQIEMLLVGLHYQCEPLLELLAHDEDIYVHTAATVFDKLAFRESECQDPTMIGLGVDETLRKVAKILTLGIAYVMGKRAFIKQVENEIGTTYDFEVASEFYRAFFDLYPEIKWAHHKAREDALVDDVIHTVTGQRRWLPPLVDDQDPDTGYWPSRERRARIIVNTPIQGGASNLLLRALNKIMRRLGRYPAVEIVNLVHDEIDFLIPAHLLKCVQEIVTECFEEAFRELFGDRLLVKIDHKVGPSWGEVKTHQETPGNHQSRKLCLTQT